MVMKRINCQFNFIGIKNINKFKKHFLKILCYEQKFCQIFSLKI